MVVLVHFMALSVQRLCSWHEAVMPAHGRPACCVCYRLEALAVHSKVCTADKPFKPLPRQPQLTAQPQEHSSNRHSGSPSAPPAAAGAALTTNPGSAASSHDPKIVNKKGSPSGTSSSIAGSYSTTNNRSSAGAGGNANPTKAAGHICGDMCFRAGLGEERDGASNGPPGELGFGSKMPKALECYLCGGQYFAKR